MAAGFFVDENDLALGKALALTRGGVFYITRDKRIRYRPVEKRMWVDHRVRGFVLTGRKSQRTIDSLALLERSWSRITDLVDSRPEGPWMYAVTDHRIQEIHLL